MPLEKRSYSPMVVKHIPEPIKRMYRQIRALVLSLNLPKEGVFPQGELERKASNDISIIVPIHNSPREVTARCLHSLEVYAANAEVILVNDASEVEANVLIMKNAAAGNGWRLIAHEKCLGHSRACEAGSRLATRKYLCLLNSDTVVTPWSWAGAKEVFDSDPQIAVVGPSTSSAATQQTIRRADYCRYYWTDAQIYEFARRYVGKQASRSWVNLVVIGGFAFFIRRSVWEEMGGFDPKLPDYGNEGELCRRVAKRGFRMVWTRNSYIHHFGKQDYGRTMSKHAITQRASDAHEYIRSLYRE